MLEITTHRSSKKSIDVIIINLNDRQLRFNGKASIKLERVLKDPKEKEANLFDCFNEYVDGMFDNDQRTQLFALYEKAHRIVENGKVSDYKAELLEVKPIVRAIFQFIDIEKYTSFIQYSRHLQVPKDLSEAASKGDYPAQTTITDTDYVEMVKFAFTVRTIYPIVFGLINRFEPNMREKHAEEVCGELLEGIPLIVTSPGWIKLSMYIDFAFNKRGIPVQADSVTSNENFSKKVLYNTIYSRLCCSVIPETEEGKNLATAINSAVRHHEGAGSPYRDKSLPSDSDEDKRSIYDKYQISEAVKSSNETVQAEFFSFGLYDEKDVERSSDRFKYVCQALGIKQPELVDRVYNNIPPNWEFELADHNLKILQLTFQGVVSPFIFEACEYYQLMSAVALAQVLLSERGYKFLPSLIGAINNPDGMRSLSEGLKLNTEDRDYIASICDIQSRNSEGRSFNEALVAATEFLERIANGKWKSNLEYGVLDEPEVYFRVKQAQLFEMEVNLEIKNEFMRLIRENNE